MVKVGEEPKTAVVFHINGIKHTVGAGSNVGTDTALVDYIRDEANLKGTKVMCREGGCGACTVTTRVIDPATGSEVIKSINSCLTPVLTCDGWDITTVEQLGDKHEGYHKIQNRLVNFHGTQCGYCTPGMVMNMYGLLESKQGNVKMEEVEKNLDSNICRCTGYRPILDAFKSLATDAPSELQQKCRDIEDCTTCPLKVGEKKSCAGKAQVATPTVLKFESGEEWVTATSFQAALDAASTTESYRFVAGNTSTGIFKNEGSYSKFIDITGIPELKTTTVDNNGITFGGGVTLTELINLVRDAAKQPGLEYGAHMAVHLERVANVSVRNNATIAGNLMIKNKHKNFPSDVFVILEALDAKITLVFKDQSKLKLKKTEETKTVSMIEFLNTDMNMKLIKSIYLPKHDGCHFRSFKITRRYQNAHAYVNAALLLKVNKSNGFTVEGKPRLVYGGISASFIHASETEAYLEGKSLADGKVLKTAFEIMGKEVKPDMEPLESSIEYRIQLTKTLLYKTILEIVGSKIGEKIASGAIDIPRNISSSKQIIDTDDTDTALYKNVPKYEAGIQASGEAEYTGDIPFQPTELHAAYITSTVANADIKDIDISEALKIPGVTNFISAKDVPGLNDTMKTGTFSPVPEVEPVFAEKKISFYGQPIGLILATSRKVALKASKVVKVSYENIKKPIINLNEAIKKAKDEGIYAKQTVGKHLTKPDKKIEIKHWCSGEISMGSQYHGYMEPQSIVCHPREDGIDVFVSSQAMDSTQNAIALVLNIPTNAINLQVRRVGGGFGGKATNAKKVACACAVATWITRRPVRLIVDLETCMSSFGKRHPHTIPYEVGFDDNGKIGSLKMDIISDSGSTMNETILMITLWHLQNVYKADGWEVDTHTVTTNTAPNTYCRAPGSVKGVAIIEWIMDRIAAMLKKDILEVRAANYFKKGDPVLFKIFGEESFPRENMIPQMIEDMKKSAEYYERKTFIEKYNKENRWKKRGLSVLPVKYDIAFFDKSIPLQVAIYHMDGHVAVSHGGIEMGQGLNTKVIQTVAQVLGIPMNKIKIKPSNNFIAANGMLTAGSLASELACYSAARACEQLRENLRPILEKMENPDWEKLIQEAYNAKVTLTASYTPGAKDDIKGYDVWVLNVVEVEIDVLTGEYKIVRTDLYEDTGKSLSPGIDLGQIEGGYIHGQGYWTTEKIVYDEKTGKLLTNGTWDYKLPFARDIPEDFRITLLSNSPNPYGVLRSKATGEPSTDAAFGVILALRQAIASARKDAGNTDWFEMSGPVSPEDIAKLCLTRDADLSF